MLVVASIHMADEMPGFLEFTVLTEAARHPFPDCRSRVAT